VTASTSGPLVRAEGLSKTYHPTPRWMRLLVRSTIRQPLVALDDVNLEVGPGEVCAVVGPNGAGKTTAFRILVGLTTPTRGSATIMGFDCEHDSLQVRRRIGWMPAEERSLIMRLSAAQNLYFHGRLQGYGGSDLRQRISATLARVGLAAKADDSVFALSSGMRARLQLARALLHDPQVLILDEPTGSVDPVAAHEMLDIITEEVERRGMAALLSSHRLEEIEALRSRVILLDRGRVPYQGDLDTLRRTWDQPRLDIHFATPDAAANAVAAVSAAGVASHETLGERDVRFQALGDVASVGRIMHALTPVLADIVDVREVVTPLRDVLARMYQRDDPQRETL
jgi:ABC-2 type transport system ATP-binding protein